MTLLFVAVAWVLPLLLALWFIRAISGMAAAQRDIAEQLRIIARALKDGSHSGIT